jgi:integrase
LLSKLVILEVKMATVTRRKWKTKISYTVQIRRRGHKTFAKTFISRADGVKWARDVERQLDMGAYANFSEANKVTLKDLFQRYIKEGKHLAKKGAKEEENRVKFLSQYPIAEISLLALSTEHIAQFRDQRLATVSPSTFNKNLSFISVVVDTAIKDWGYQIPTNPIRNVRRLKEPKPRERVLSVEEYQRLAKACDQSENKYLRAMVDLSIETAMRQGELLSLTYNQINFDKRTIFLPDTKNGYSRTVPLSQEAINIIEKLPRQISGKMFPKTRDSLKFWFKQAKRRAKINDFKWHDLRRCACTALFQKGYSIEEVLVFSGHRDPRILLSTYTKLDPSKIARKFA